MADEETGLRERLLAATIDALEAGSPDVSLRAVARAAGVSAMAPYRHFADKNALMGAAAECGFGLLRQTLEEADANSEGASALVAQGMAYLRFAEANRALFRLMFSQSCEPAARGEAGEAAFLVLAGRVGRLTDDPSATLACWALAHGLATLALDGRRPVDDAQAEAALTLLAQRVAAEGTSSGAANQIVARSAQAADASLPAGDRPPEDMT